MDEKITYSVVIPCYRSGDWLPDLVERLVCVMRSVDEPFEILLINDASPDNTWDVVEELCDKYHELRGVDLLFNAGQFRATICGLENARGDFIITIDDDLQHPPEEVVVLIDAIRERADVDCVIGAYSAKRHSVIRNLGSLGMGWLNGVLFGKPSDLQCTSFRIMRSQVAQAVCAHRTARPIIGPLLLRSTNRIVNVEVQHNPRSNGTSGYSMKRLIRIIADNIVSASTLPLKMVSALGFICALASVALGVFYLVRYFLGQIAVPGFVTQVLLIIFFGGMTLLSIGLLGEYIIRIIHEVGRAPRYFVRNEARYSGERDLKKTSALDNNRC